MQNKTGCALNNRILLFILGYPLFILVFKNNIFTIVIGLLLYTLLIVGRDIIRSVWKKLFPKVVNAISSEIERFVQERFSHNTARYIKHIEHRYRTIETQGQIQKTPYALEVEDVFVDLQVDISRSHSSSIIAYGSETSSNHNIWFFLNSDIFHHLVILGPAGSGKTTLLKHMSLVLVNRAHRRKFKAPKKLPILLSLRNCAPLIVNDPEITLVDVIMHQMKQQQHKDKVPPASWFNRLLDNGQYIIMLDGLDEISDSKARKQSLDWASSQISQYDNNRFILTSRDYAFAHILDKADTLDVLPFSREKVAEFTTRWFTATLIKSYGRKDKQVLEEARERANSLLNNTLYLNEELEDLSVNPLLLTMITNIYFLAGFVPTNKKELYDAVINVLLRRDELRGIHSEIGLSVSQKQGVLEPLAYSMMCSGINELNYKSLEEAITVPLLMIPKDGLTAHNFIIDIEQRCGIIHEKEPGIYEFVHRTFLEYLAAVHVKENRLEDELLKHIDEVWWHQTIRLYSSMVDATNVITVCLEKSPVSVLSLVLASECAAEAGKLDPQLRTQIKQAIENGIESDDNAVRQLIARTKIHLRLKKDLLHLENIYISVSPISNGEFQLLIDAEMGCFRPLHRSEPTYAKGTGSDPILGISGEAANKFCEWLTKSRGDNWLYRLPTDKEFALLKNNVSLEGYQYWVNNAGMLSLAPDQFIKISVSDLHNLFIREEILDHLKLIKASSKINIPFSPLTIMGERMLKAVGFSDLNTLASSLNNQYEQLSNLKLDQSFELASSILAPLKLSNALAEGTLELISNPFTALESISKIDSLLPKIIEAVGEVNNHRSFDKLSVLNDLLFDAFSSATQLTQALAFKKLNNHPSNIFPFQSTTIYQLLQDQSAALKSLFENSRKITKELIEPEALFIHTKSLLNNNDPAPNKSLEIICDILADTIKKLKTLKTYNVNKSQHLFEQASIQEHAELDKLTDAKLKLADLKEKRAIHSESEINYKEKINSIDVQINYYRRIVDNYEKNKPSWSIRKNRSRFSSKEEPTVFQDPYETRINHCFEAYILLKYIEGRRLGLFYPTETFVIVKEKPAPKYI